MRKLPLVLTINTLTVEPVTDENPDTPAPARVRVLPAPKPKILALPWSLSTSVFATFQFDTPELLADSFEADLSHTRIDKLCKTDEDLAQVAE